MRWIDGRTTRALRNDHFHGIAFAWIFLAIHGAMNLFRGSVHTFKSDGGAASIAGIDLSQNGEVILSLFAGMGVGQLLMSAVDFAVAFRFRGFAPVLLGFYLIEQVGVALAVWFWRPMPLEAPGKYGAVAMIPVIAIALYCALPKSAAAPASPRAAQTAT